MRSLNKARAALRAFALAAGVCVATGLAGGLGGCVAIPAIGAIGAIGAVGAVGGTAAAVGGTAAAVGGTSAVIGGTAATVGGTTAVVGGTAAAAGGTVAAATGGAGAAAGSTAGGASGVATGYQPATTTASRSAGNSATGAQQQSGKSGVAQSGPGYRQGVGPGGVSQSGPGYSQGVGPGGAYQSGPGYSQGVGPGGASQSGPGFSQGVGPGGASQSGPGFYQGVSAGGAAQSFPLAPTTGMLVAGAVIVAVAIVSHELLAVDLSPAGRAEAERLGLKIETTKLRHLDLEIARLRAPDSANVTTLLAALRAKDPNGAYDVNPIYRIASSDEPCAGVRCYGRGAIGWRAERCKDEDEISLGMIDSALDPEQPEFEDANLHRRRFSTTDKPAPAETEHGSAVAALLVGRSRSDFPGLLPKAELYAADIFSLDAHGQLETNAARFVTALDWLAGEKVGVINVSLAGPDSRVLHTAIQRAVARGIAVVAASGNLGANGAPQYPAAYPEAIAVTAVDRGGRLYAQASRGPYVSFAAPGYEIWTPGAKGVGAFRNGTSFAAPFVTAAYAQARHAEPDAKPGALLDELRAKAKPIREAGGGAGLVQALGCGRRED